jgi:hypothetical protein
MTPAQALDQHRSMLAEIGEDIEVRRYAGSGAARVFAKRAIVRGRVLGMGSKELVGETVQGTRKVILLNDPSAAVAPGNVALVDLLPLTVSDRLFFRNTEVAILGIDDDTRRIAGVLIAIEVMARG